MFDWSEYVKVGIYKLSKLMVWEINEVEVNKMFIYFSKGEFVFYFFLFEIM